jgi:hypothetical protein
MPPFTSKIFRASSAVFDRGKYMPKYLVDALAVRLKSFRKEVAGANAFASRLAHQRNTPSCRATAAILMPLRVDSPLSTR